MAVPDKTIKEDEIAGLADEESPICFESSLNDITVAFSQGKEEEEIYGFTDSVESSDVQLNGFAADSDDADDVFINDTVDSKDNILCDDQIVAELLNMSSSLEDEREVELSEHFSASTIDDEESFDEEKHNLHHVQGPCFCLTCKSKR